MGAEPVPPVASLATAWLGDVDTLTDRLVTAIFTGNPEWTDYGPVSHDDLRDGCRRYLARVLELLGDDGGVPAIDDDPVAGQIGRDRAEQGVPLEVMLRTFRLGGRVVWEALLERSLAVPVDPRVLGTAATAMWTVVDGLSSALSTSYRRAQLERTRRDDQRRHALIEEVLAGRATDGGFGQRVADQLELPVGGGYLVVVADLGADGTAALPSPQSTLAALGVRSVWHVRSDTLVGIVPMEGHESRFVLDRLRPLARGRVAAATVTGGLADVALAHRLAVLTLGTMPRTAAGLVLVEDRLAESLLLRSPELARRIVGAWLGPVMQLPARERDVLLETLTGWLEADRSAGVAAEHLFCHRNTVLNRLRRFEHMTGRSTGSPRDVTELTLALDAYRLLGDGGAADRGGLADR
jgi:PucR C-terminal helix-turn-helix domain/GGDEF-like domain